ncbi:MAG: ornithine carbamoyltransferase [Planctomycetota bacterium]
MIMSRPVIKPKHMLKLKDYSPDEINAILDLAAKQKADPSEYSDKPFAGKEVALIFEKDSLRTRFSFEIATRQLGGNALFVNQMGKRLGERESAEDQARVLARYVHCIVLRTYSQEFIETVAQYAGVPVINALSDFSHPCQALADMLTIRERFGRLDKVRITYLGDGNNVARSLAYAGKLTGATVVICAPDGFQLSESDRLAAPGPGKVEYSNNPKEAVKTANVVYTDVWASMGQEAEAAEREKIFSPYQINASLMSHAAKGAIFLHCLPAHRGLEVTDEVMDSEYSAVFDQAENRLHVQRALMTLLIQNY